MKSISSLKFSKPVSFKCPSILLHTHGLFPKHTKIILVSLYLSLLIPLLGIILFQILMQISSFIIVYAILSSLPKETLGLPSLNLLFLYSSFFRILTEYVTYFALLFSVAFLSLKLNYLFLLLYLFITYPFY